MFLSDASVRRPIAMCCLFIALVILGINAYREMGLELMPKIDIPYITVITVYPGATPKEVETDIAKRIEDAVGSVDGLKHITNSCMENACLTLLEFNLDVSLDVAATDVREKLDLIVNDFPAEVEKPKILKFDMNAQPIINLALTGEAPLEELYDYADNELNDRLSALPGVAEIQVIGGSENEVQVQLDRDALAAHGLSSLDVVRAIQEGVRTIPSGRVRQGTAEYSVKFDAEYADVEAIGGLEVANREIGVPGRDGSRCYISDLGNVVMTPDEQRQRAFIDGRPCVAIRVVKRADANAVRVVQNVRQAAETIEKTLPGGMELVWASDNGAFIKANVDSTISDIWQGILLTAVILFLFLVNVRSTLIVAVTMPLTILVSLFFLKMLDYTLNVSTLLAVGLSVGILVTNSIVVLESIVKHASASDDPRKAARIGAHEVAIAVFASAGTNIVVLFPIAMMGGIVGLFFRPFALTMVVVTFASLFISFTLTPILCAILLRRRYAQADRSVLARLADLSDAAFNRIVAVYTGFLRAIGRHRWMALPILGVSLLIFFQSLLLVPKVGFGFMPETDQGLVFVKLEFPTRYNLGETEKRLKEVEERLVDLAGLDHTLVTIGKVEGVVGQATEGVYLAQLIMKFEDKTQRGQSLDGLMDEIRARTASYPDCITTVSKAEIIGGQGYPIELEIAGEDLATLDRLAETAKELALNIDGFVDPDTSVRMGKSELRIRPRRAVLADLGVPATSMGLALRANLAGIKAGMFKQGDRTYDIRVKLVEQEGKDQVAGFLFPGAPGHPMVLSSLADVEETLTPVQITRTDKRRVSKMLSQLHNTKPLGTAADELGRALDASGELPAGYSYRFAKMYEIMAEAQAEFVEAALIAMLLTYLLLAAILESFVKPFIIFVTIPLGLIGVLWALYLTGQSISMFVLLAGVMLIGIVVNNAILIMDRVSQYRKQGFPPHEAMAHAAGEELRPILMITLAAILGMLPLALGSGLGSELRNGIGIASVGGLAVSAVLTLVILPALYELLTRERTPSKEGQPPAQTTP